MRVSRVSPRARGHRLSPPARPQPERSGARDARGAQSFRFPLFSQSQAGEGAGGAGERAGEAPGRKAAPHPNTRPSPPLEPQARPLEPPPEPSLTSQREEARKDEVEALLADLGSQIRRGGDTSILSGAADLQPTGLPELDALLGGGLPRGGLSEISGPPSSGRSLLALSTLADTTSRGELAAWVDVADAFDPGSAEDSGVALERVLWTRAPRLSDAFRCVERLLETEGFPLVFLDLCTLDLPTRSRPTPQPAVWLRLGRLATATRTALVVLSIDRLAGARADVALAMHAALPCFRGSPPLLEALELRAELVRHRTAPLGAIALRAAAGADFYTTALAPRIKDPSTNTPSASTANANTPNAKATLSRVHRARNRPSAA